MLGGRSKGSNSLQSVGVSGSKLFIVASTQEALLHLQQNSIVVTMQNHQQHSEEVRITR